MPGRPIGDAGEPSGDVQAGEKQQAELELLNFPVSSFPVYDHSCVRYLAMPLSQLL